MTTLDDLMLTLADAGKRDEAVMIAPDKVADVLEELEQVLEKLSLYRDQTELQRKATIRANRIFKRANKWPPKVYPDMGTLIDWLLEHYSRRQAVKFQLAIEYAFEKLIDLGMVGWDETVPVPGHLIISLRSRLGNILDEAKEQNSSYLYDEENTGTAHNTGDDDIFHRVRDFQK